MVNVEGVACLPLVTNQVFPESPAVIHITSYPRVLQEADYVPPPYLISC